MQALLQTEHESLKAVDFLVLLNPGDMNEILEVIFKQILVLDGLGICNEIGLRGLSLDLSNDKWTLVQAMALSSDDKSGFSNQPFVQLCKVPGFCFFFGGGGSSPVVCQAT